jgi:hypothetical protein
MTRDAKPPALLVDRRTQHFAAACYITPATDAEILAQPCVVAAITEAEDIARERGANLVRETYEPLVAKLLAEIQRRAIEAEAAAR